MVTSQYLTKFKLHQLKNLSFLLGLPVTLRKDALCETLAYGLNSTPPPDSFNKILSVDMGLRNLGICLLQVPHLTTIEGPLKNKHQSARNSAPLTVTVWQKVDVLSQLGRKHGPDVSCSDHAAKEKREVSKIRIGKRGPTGVADFSAESLAKLAYPLVCDLLVKYKPSSILIERQRHRSNGAPTVQEWTVRVNLLEGMIWACLETLRAQYGSGALCDSPLSRAVRELKAVAAVSPAKVAKFWCSGLSTEYKKEVESGESGTFRHEGRGVNKISKADKIAVVQPWVDDWIAGGQRGSAQLDFAGAAAETATAFQSTVGKRKPRKKKGEDGEGEKSIGKLDDLADCLLQGVAWVKWEENRQKLAEAVAKG